MTRALVIALLAPLLFADVARGDDAIPRYVAQQGEDRGDCSLPVRPCRTIQYALSVAGKGDHVRVAGGAYQLPDVGDALAIVGGAVDVRGGFDRFDHFLQQSPTTNRTSLVGVPVALRAHLQALGFHVVADRKTIGATDKAAIEGFQVTQAGQGAAPCRDNAAGEYPCKDVDLLSHLARSDLSSSPASIADVWGFVDLNTEREYALLGMMNGLAVVDVTDPTVPVEVGTVPGALSGWRDVKVTQRYDVGEDRWNTYAYVSTEYGGRLVVVDLTELPNHVRLARRSDTSAHNVYVSNVDYMSTYSRGLTVLDITDPLQPVEVGLFDTHPASDDKYYGGAWGVYPFLPSGNVLISDIRGGLYVLGDRTLSSDHIQVGFSSTTFGGEEGEDLSIEVVRRGAGGAVSVDYAVRAGSAGEADLTTSSGTLHWPPTERHSVDAQSLSVPLLRDDVVEPIERAFVRLSNPAGGAVLSDINMAYVFVADPGRGASVGFAETQIAVEETSKRLIATVQRVGSPLGAVSVDYEVGSLSASPGSDYVDVEPGQLSWADGDATARTIVVPLLKDYHEELAEQFEIRLSSPTGAALADDRLVVDINADGMAVTGFMLFDDANLQDLQPIPVGKRLATDAVPGNAGIRVEVRKPDEVRSVGLTVDGADETHTDNDAPYVFRVLGDTPEGEYTLRATPYSQSNLGGVSGEPLVVNFSIGDEPVVLSSDAMLMELELSGIDLDFNADIADYEATVGPQVARTTVSVGAAAGATYAIGPDDADANVDGHQMDLAIGTNSLEIAVTAEDGEAKRNYTVEVVRAPFVTGP